MKDIDGLGLPSSSMVVSGRNAMRVMLNWYSTSGSKEVNVITRAD